MDEIHLWRWRYTNEVGKRVESSWRMSASEAAKVFRRREDRGHAGYPKIGRRHQRLDEIAASVLAGIRYECAWDLFRFGQLKAGTHEKAVHKLAAWCRRFGIEPSFEIRVVAVGEFKRHVIYVLLAPLAG